MEGKETYTPFAPMEEGQQGYEAHYVYSERMEVTQYHCHDYFEFYVHLRGGELMGVDERLYQLKPNHLFVLPPFTMHGLSCTEEMLGYERAYLNISPEVLRTLGCGQIELERFFQNRYANGLNTYQLSEGDCIRLVHWIRLLTESEKKEKNAVSRFNDYTLMMSAVNLICQTIGSAEVVEGTEVSNSVIQNVLAYINNNYNQTIRISELAKRFGISESYLSHEFSRFTRRSIYEYILYRRIMLARQMMLKDTSLNTIAYQCGFNDYSNFLRSFTKMVGVSPSQYRKQLRRFRNLEG